MHSIDITGVKCGRWTVLSRAENTKQGQAQWLCRCECGTEKVLKSIIIRREISKSCGCLKLEVLVKRSTKHGHATGGITPTYHTWASMVARCTNSNSREWKNYGGRGISVCERWMTFANFLADMGEKPEGLSLDRFPDMNGNYELGNCRWASDTQQARNKRNNRLLSYKGDIKSLAEWAEILGVNRLYIHNRLRRGMTVEQAFDTSDCRGPRKHFVFDGMSKTISGWARHFGVDPQAFLRQFNNGVGVPELISHHAVTPRLGQNLKNPP